MRCGRTVLFLKRAPIEGEGHDMDRYLLMNKDTIAAEFILNIMYGTEEFTKLNQKGSYIPYGLSNINDWIERRQAAKRRKHLRKLMKECGCDSKSGFISMTRCASLNDTFWIKRESDPLDWNNVSLYRNEYDERIADIAFDGTGAYGRQLPKATPELSTDGSFEKCWLREGDRKIFLYKRGSDGAAGSGTEPYSEVFASQVLNVLGFPHVDYDAIHYHGKLASRCALFTSEKTGFVNFAAYAGRPTTLSEKVEIYKRLGLEERFREMVIADALILNTDRHEGNFGFLVDNDSGEVIEAAPLFDHNLSLLPLPRLEPSPRLPKPLKSGIQHRDHALELLARHPAVAHQRPERHLKHHLLHHFLAALAHGRRLLRIGRTLVPGPAAHHLLEEGSAPGVLHELADGCIFINREADNGGSLHLHGLRDEDVPAALADLDRKLAALHEEIVHLRLVVRKCALIERETHRFGLARQEIDLGKIAQLADRAAHRALLVADIELDDSLARDRAGVGHVHGDGEGILIRQGLPVHGHIAEGERRVGEAVAEREIHGQLLLVVVAVADENALGIGDHAVLAREIQVGGVVLEADRPGFGEAAGGVYISEKDIDSRGTDLLAAEVHQKHGRNLAKPGQFHRGAAVQDDHRVRVGRRDRRDQLVLVLRQAHMLAVAAFRLK